MKSLPAWFRVVVRILGFLVPSLMVAIAHRMFWNLGKPMAVRPEAAATHARARRETVTVGARQVVVYRWGTGDETVLLVHGWRGRAAQFAALVEALESPERTIVAFDAPGNGDSPGDRTDLRDYIAAIRSVAATANGIDLLIGHSFGVVAVFVAVREGVRAGRIVSIAGVSDLDYTFEAFARALDLAPRVSALLRKKIERSVFDRDATIWRRFVSELDPSGDTPLLIAHDRDDRIIEFSESTKIAKSHHGPTTEVHTTGLGHSRVLSDRTVVRTIVNFAGEPAQTKSAAE